LNAYKEDAIERSLPAAQFSRFLFSTLADEDTRPSLVSGFSVEEEEMLGMFLFSNSTSVRHQGSP